LMLAGTVWRDVWYAAMRVAHCKRERRKLRRISAQRYFSKAKRRPRSETLCWSSCNIELVRSGLLAAETNTSSEKKTNALANTIFAMSFISPPTVQFDTQN
jgi:hypothetical protein